MLPDFEDGLLPEGIHEATLDEVMERLGWNPHRRALLAGLRRVLVDLKAAGCPRAWLDGSFVTEKEAPDDFDLCWDMDGVDFDVLAAPLIELDPPRALQKAIYGGDVLPNVIEAGSGQPFLDFFQQESDSGRARGIIQINLGGEL